MPYSVLHCIHASVKCWSCIYARSLITNSCEWSKHTSQCNGPIFPTWLSRGALYLIPTLRYIHTCTCTHQCKLATFCAHRGLLPNDGQYSPGYIYGYNSIRCGNNLLNSTFIWYTLNTIQNWRPIWSPVPLMSKGQTHWICTLRFPYHRGTFWVLFRKDSMGQKCSDVYYHNCFVYGIFIVPFYDGCTTVDSLVHWLVSCSDIIYLVCLV